MLGCRCARMGVSYGTVQPRDGVTCATVRQRPADWPLRLPTSFCSECAHRFAQLAWYLAGSFGSGGGQSAAVSDSILRRDTVGILSASVSVCAFIFTCAYARFSPCSTV